MKFDESFLKLYAVTDRFWTGSKTLAEQVKESIEGGVTMVQLREKNLDYSSFKKEAAEIKKICAEYSVPLLINDNVLLAKEIDADGVHIGQDDMPLCQARKILGAEKIIGVSVQTAEEAAEAEKNGADYIGIGAVFPTNSKDDALLISEQTLIEICGSAKIPAVAIGGITAENIALLKQSGIRGIAVISAIFAQKDIKSAAEKLRRKVEEIL